MPGTLQLSDIQAPIWHWGTGVPGKPPVQMKPLSLATFAEAELRGCGLEHLMNPDPDAQMGAWVELYAFLRGEDSSLVAREAQLYPEGFTQFVQFVQQSFGAPAKEEQVEYRHRRNKDPRNEIETADGRSMKGEGGQTDYTVLFDLARYSRVALSDIYRMTFRGFIALTRHLNDNPPVPVL